MKAFELVHPSTIAEASRLLVESGDAGLPMSGGQDLLGQMKDYISSPDRVVDLKRIPSLDKIDFDAKRSLRIGALATLSDIEHNPAVRANFPVLADAAMSVASIQIRNVATIGGNLCQRPRCWYFRNEHIVCLKKGGDKCCAAGDDAENKYHAIIAGGPCHIVHPSDLAPALISLDATVTIAGPGGAVRRVPLAEFFTLPKDGPIAHETVLKTGEIVTEVIVPPTPLAARSVYLKCREKDSFDFALVSVALSVALDGTTVRDARIVLGGVAPVPWRAKAAEAALRGKPLTSAAVAAAVSTAATVGAVPMAQNGYKVPLTQALVRRAMQALADGPRKPFSTLEEMRTWTG